MATPDVYTIPSRAEYPSWVQYFAATFPEHLPALMDMINTRLNPPARIEKLKEVVFTQTAINKRQNYVDNYREAVADDNKNLMAKYRERYDDLNRKYHFDILGTSIFDDLTLPQAEEEQKRLGEREVTPANPPYSIDEVGQYIVQVVNKTDKLMRERGVTHDIPPEQIATAVAGLLFKSWVYDDFSGEAIQDPTVIDYGMLWSPEQIDKHGGLFQFTRTEVIDELGTLRETSMPFPQDTLDAIGDVLQSESDILSMNPDLLLRSDKMWVAMEQAQKAGLYTASEMQVIRMAIEDVEINEETAREFLNDMGIDPGGNAVETLDNVTASFMETMSDRMGDLVDQSATLPNMPGSLYEFAIQTNSPAYGGRGPEDVFPMFGAEEKQYQEDYKLFTDFNWDFNKTAEENALKYFNNISGTHEGVTYKLNPSGESWPGEIGGLRPDITRANLKKATKYHRDSTITTMGESTVFADYNAAVADPERGPSLAEAFAAFSPFIDGWGSPDSANEIIRGPEITRSLSLMKVENWEDRVESGKERLQIAKDYLDRMPEIIQNADAAMLKQLYPVITKYLIPGSGLSDGIYSLDDLVNLEELAAEVKDKYVDLVINKPFKSTDAPYSRFNAIVGHMVRVGGEQGLSLGQERALKKVDIATIEGLSEMTRGYASIAEAIGDESFRSVLFDAVGRGHDILDQERQQQHRADIDAEGAIQKSKRDQLKAQQNERDRERAELNSNISQKIFKELQVRGIVGRNSSPEFAAHISDTVIPDLVKRISDYGGVDTETDLTSHIDDAFGRMTWSRESTSKRYREFPAAYDDPSAVDVSLTGDAAFAADQSGTRRGRPTGRASTGYLPAYDIFEEDFTRQWQGELERGAFYDKKGDVLTPPGVPGMHKGVAGFRIVNRYQPAPPPEPTFDISSLRPELQEMGVRRPEFASYLQSRMQDPGYMQKFKELGRTRVDAEGADAIIRGVRNEEGKVVTPGFETKAAKDRYGYRQSTEFQERQASLQYAQESIDQARAEDNVGARKAFEKLQRNLTQEERDREADISRYTGPDFQRAVYQLKTTPGMTSEEYYRSRIPGFEEEFKGSVFYEEEQKRLTREREREEATAESQRRARLRRGGGSGGRAMAVFRQARV